MLSGIDKQLNDALQMRGMPVEEFAKTAAAEGIRYASKSKLFEAFRGVKALSNETALDCWNLWKEIDQLSRSVEPLILDLSDGERVHRWLQARRLEQLSVCVSTESLYISQFSAGVVAGLRGEAGE